MEPTNEIPMFIDVNQEHYIQLDKQNVLATILKQSADGTVETLQQSAQMEVQTSPSEPLERSEDPQQGAGDARKPRLRCPECNRYTTDNEERMVRHIRKNHQGLNPFQCGMCDYSTYNKSVFEEHVRVHKGIKPFQCAHCPYRSASKKNKNKHELIHRKNNPLKCDLCPFIAHHFRSLLCHKQKHENGELDSEVTNAPSSLQCEVCLFRFKTPTALQRHKTNHKSRVCDVCQSRFCSEYYLKKHMAAMHQGALKKDTFKCAKCGWYGAVRMKVLLHLIHHPQPVDFDVTVLRKHGIVI